MIHFQSLTQAELAELLKSLSTGDKQARYRAKQLFHWVYERFVTDWDLMTNVSKETRGWLKENVSIHRLSSTSEKQAEDGTRKFLWELSDKNTIESVIIPAHLVEEGDVGRERLTACISSQVGCAMKCKFCLTGIQGLSRNLEVHEIVGQVYELRRVAPITNIVFMGMGEPLHNLKNVIQACRILLDGDGFKFSKRKVTVSTSGLVKAMEELGGAVDVCLAVSLNATTDEQRQEIMPINKKWNIAALLQACRNYPVGGHRRITFEYVLLRDFNDSLDDAKRLVKLLHGQRCKINLIPFNEHSESIYKRPLDAKIKAFQKYLLDRDFTATIRQSRGRDILAACGQLRSLAPQTKDP